MSDESTASLSAGPDPLAGDVDIRPLRTDEEFEACIGLQRETWGNDFRELVPPALLKVSQRVGGIAAGAFEGDGRLVGFVFGLTGIADGALTHWSHMLAVAEDRRDAGIGRRLKLYQRDRLRALGVREMRWTYDPLVARNAHLNLNRLGARVVEYVENMYGINPLSTTDSVIGSDRFVVAWTLDTDPQRSRNLPRAPAAPWVTPETERLPTDTPVYVEIPPDIQALKLRRPNEARTWRYATRRALLHYLGVGYTVSAFHRDPDSGRCGYALTAHPA